MCPTLAWADSASWVLPARGVHSVSHSFTPAGTKSQRAPSLGIGAQVREQSANNSGWNLSLGDTWTAKGGRQKGEYFQRKGGDGSVFQRWGDLAERGETLRPQSPHPGLTGSRMVVSPATFPGRPEVLQVRSRGSPPHPLPFRKRMGASSLVAQWQRIHLPTQETRVRSLVREDPAGCGATKPALQLLSCALDPESHDYQPTRCNDRGRVP